MWSLQEVLEGRRGMDAPIFHSRSKVDILSFVIQMTKAAVMRLLYPENFITV